MFALLNRFAWLIAIMIWLQFSFFIDRDGPFNEEWFITFIIVLLIVKFWIISWWFIKSRLDFFANSISKNYIKEWLSPTNKVEKEIIDLSEIQKEKDIENTKLLEEVRLRKEKENKDNVYKAYAENKKVEKIDETIEEPSKLSIAIKNFFSENLLAKLGWILVFMWVLFFLSLVYSAIWPVWKLIIWFSVWFIIFLAWVWLDKKDLANEWRILLWIWILINYLVILSWRYLIWDSVDNNILTVWTTFLLLIMNTSFAVVTSLVYKSRTLLLFSFLFAFINPLLVWWSSDNPYTLVWYSLIVAFGWLYLAHKDKDILLAVWIFILSNILFLIAPLSSDIHWIVKLVWSAVISISTILVVYKIDVTKLSTIFIWSYAFLILLLWSWDNYIKETTSFISYMITILLYFGIWIYYFLKTSFNSLIYILLSPIFIILGLSFCWDIFSIPLSLSIIVLIYLLGFNFIQSKLPNFLKYVFFIILWIYIFFTNWLISLNQISLDLPSFITVIIISFVFIFTSYYLSTKKDLEFLYSIWTIGWILTLSPILINKVSNNLYPPITSQITEVDPNIALILSIISIIIFSISNWILPFINKNLLEKKSNLKNIIIWSITWILFIWYQLFSFWNEYFPWIILWFTFIWLAIAYFIMSYAMLEKLWIENIKKEEKYKNIIYSYLAISISVFSLAIALIFSNYESVISLVWLFEATILFYFYNKTKETKIYFAWIILFLIWIIKLFSLINIVATKDFIFLIPFSLIAISLVLNLKFIDFIKEIEKKIFHDILHILWIIALAILLVNIIPNTWHGWSILWISIFISISSLIYSYFNSYFLKIFFIIIFTLFLLLQIWQFDSIVWKLEYDKLNYLIILQYITTILLAWSIIVWNKLNKQKSLNNKLNIIYWIYFIIITSMYIYNIFNSTFAVTIYWWISSSIILFYGISKDKIKLRTIWLYLISLTTLKIFLYDIWYGLDDAISRVAALIILWVLFIIISTQYTKKYWNNILWELSFKNLKNKDKIIKESNLNKEEKNETKETEKEDSSINIKIKDVDVWNIKSVQLIFLDQTITIRAINLIKIVKIITDNSWKTKFEKWELKETYDYIKKNYKSDLSKINYDKIINILETFVKEWWEVKLIEK